MRAVRTRRLSDVGVLAVLTVWGLRQRGGAAGAGSSEREWCRPVICHARDQRLILPTPLRGKALLFFGGRKPLARRPSQVCTVMGEPIRALLTQR